SGNFDPAKKLNKAGDTMTGDLTTVGLRVGYPGNAVCRVFSSAGVVYWDSRSSYDGALPDATAYYRAVSHEFRNSSGNRVVLINGSG
ncbi:hypothetical protein, partial [Enterobacter hormaechei]